MEWMGCLLTRCRSAVRVETLYRHPLLAPLAQRRPATGRSDSSWLQCYIHSPWPAVMLQGPPKTPPPPPLVRGSTSSVQRY
jgi:hypothetical protein